MKIENNYYLYYNLNCLKLNDKGFDKSVVYFVLNVKGRRIFSILLKCAFFFLVKNILIKCCLLI